MAELKMTPRRLEMLRAIGDGAVTQHWRPMSGGRPYSDVNCVGAGWPVRGRLYERVTGRVAELYDAELCGPGERLHPGYWGSRRWELTDAGRAVLAVHGTAP